jgi:hypothetical protein
MHPNTPQEICDALETTKLRSCDSLSVSAPWRAFSLDRSAFFTFENMFNSPCYRTSHASTEQNAACSAGFRETRAQSFRCTFKSSQRYRKRTRMHD